jgi:hypothetical protein
VILEHGWRMMGALEAAGAESPALVPAAQV